jgi:hypothetical protein
MARRDTDKDRPPGDRSTMRARKEMRTFARAFRSDTPGSRRLQTFPLMSMRPEPVTPTTIKMHVLERDPPAAVNAAHHDWRPLSDGVFASVVGRLAWTIIISAGIVGCAILASAWLFGKR